MNTTKILSENNTKLGHRKRAKEKFLKSLGKELHDYEILEILFFGIFPRSDTKPLAKKLLAKFGSIASIINADIDQLQDVEGVGSGAAILIKIVAEIAHRILRSDTKSLPILDNWQLVFDYAKSRLAHLNYETFIVLFLNKKFELISDENLASGNHDSVQIDIKLLVKKSLLLNASSVVLMHNHPTSNVNPSTFDIKTTNEISAALKPLNIRIIDHLIVGKKDIFSFKKEGLI